MSERRLHGVGVLVLSVFVVGVGCARAAPASPNDASPKEKPMTEARDPPIVPRTGKAALATGHVLFIAKPAYFQRLDCEVFESASAPHRRPPRPLHDATDTPARHRTDLEIVEVLQGPAAPPVARPKAGEAPKAAKASVYLALGERAFSTDHHERASHAYDAAWCRRLNESFTSPFVVVHAYPISVDRGNRSPDPLEGPWRSLGTDPSKPSAGFQTIEEARAYASTLLPHGPPEP